MRAVCVLLLLTAAHAFHPEGVDHEADLQCHVCNASYYCLNGQQFDCPVNSLAAVALADSIAECVCNPGYLREGDLCNLGAPPAWYMYGNRSFCVHTRETIAAGASGHADCVCVPGFAGLPAAEPVHCEACPADTFTDVHNTSECVPCPAHASHNETRRANVTACLCDPGYTGPDGGPCVACAAGTFKAEPGAAACEGCGVNEYSYAAAAVCVACHANSTSLPRSPGVDHCRCDPGFYPFDDLCSMCHAGRFKNTTKNEPCKPCTGNTFASTVGATACTSCLVSSPFSTANPSEGGVRCQCVAGYTQTELNLTTPACSACAADTYQPSQGQTTCQLCDPSARSPEASVTPLACLCNAGFADDSAHECLVCAGGTYKEAAADDEEDTEPCDVCPYNSFSLPQSGRLADCLCDPGFSGPDGGPCVACAPGKFKAANGSAACQDCPLHTYSDAAASTSCKSCTQFLDFGGITLAPGQDSSDDCECDVSQGFSTVYVNGARKCTGCKAGTYASAEGCRNCSNGTFNDEGAQTTCKQCPVNASSYDYPHVSCQCHKGYTCKPPLQLTVENRQRHDAGGGVSFTDFNEWHLVLAYNGGLYRTWQHNELYAFLQWYYNLTIPTPNTANQNPQWTELHPFFKQNLPECQVDLSNHPCQLANKKLPTISYSQQMGVFVFKWYVKYTSRYIMLTQRQNGWMWFQCGDQFGWLVSCSAFDGNYNNIAVRGVQVSADQFFEPGSQVSGVEYLGGEIPGSCSADVCQACPANTFKNYHGMAAFCTDCQTNSESLPASISQDVCLCKRGFRQNGPEVCVACTGGTYSDVLDTLACTSCPVETFTPQHLSPWDTPSDCQACDVCNQATNPTFTDHYDAARAGLGCGLDQPSSCQACPAAASLFLPTTESNRNKGVTSCVCDRHFYGVIGSACAACPSNQVRPDFINAATTLADCLCAPGFEPDPAAANLCRQCPIGKYKPFAGDHNCTACPATLTTEQTGNANASACVCAPGRGYVGDICVTCLANHYKTGHNLHTCLPCRDHAFAPPGSTAARDCLCGPGFSIEVPESFKKQACMQYTAPSAASVTSLYWQNYQDFYVHFQSPKVIPREYYDWGGTTCGNIPWDFFGDAVVMTGYPQWGGEDSTFSYSPVSAGHYLGNICYMAQRFYGSHVGCFNQAPYWPVCQFNVADAEPRRPLNMPCQSAEWQVRPWTDGCYHTGPCVPSNGIKLYFEMFRGTADWRQITSSTWVSVDHVAYSEKGIDHMTQGISFEGRGGSTCATTSSSTTCAVFGNSLCTVNAVDYPYWTRYWTWTKYETRYAPWCTNCRLGYNDEGLYGGMPFNFDDQGVCKSTGTTSNFRQMDSHRAANWLWARDYKNDPEAFCQVCPPGHYKDTAANLLCAKCPFNSATNNTGSMLCDECAAGKTTDGRTGQVECVCDVGTEPGTDGVCQTCRAGRFKATSTDKYANRECVACGACGANNQVATECNSTHNITCRACQANSWASAGRTRLDPCFCNAGYELQGSLCVACPIGKARQANANNSIACATCGPGFANTSTQSTCHPCSAICPVQFCQQQLRHDFTNYNDITSWKNYATSIGATFVFDGWQKVNGFDSLFVLGAGKGFIQLTLPSQYTHVTVNYHNTHNNGWPVSLYINGVVVQQAPILTAREYSQTYTSPTVLKIEEEYDSIGADLIITLRRSCDAYVRLECNASRDVICQECQACAAGFYANNTCGVSYGNDRLDTQCAVCPADFYCPGGSLTQAALPCPDNGRSAPGSDAIADCTCEPGFYRSGDLCVICPLDAYCPRGVFEPVACPPPGRTFFQGSAVRLDCHCPRGHFRDPPGDEERFNCSLCTPDDYCFNNSLYNCSDALMESEPGSGFFDNCTCVNRYYNNGTRCEDCNVDFSCVGGRQHACPPLEWTNGLTRQEACVCRRGFVRAGAGAGANAECVPCADDFFCDGSDDRQHPCPPSSLGRAATNVSECLCNVSFEVVHSSNVSEPHSCRECPHDFFKNTVGNTLCQACTRCLPASDSVWTRIVCDAEYDALCDACTVCHDPAAADTPAEQWAGVGCQEFADTVCANCTLCDYAEEWERAPCVETRDRECAAIQRGRACEVGQYAGNHSRTTDSECLPCAMNDTLYEDQQLHVYTSAGRRYDDATSCDIACRPFSRLRDVANPALGCVSCETGNVLFKVFTQNDAACTFTCLAGYVRAGDDCVLAPLQASPSSYWNHSLNVTHVRRVAVHGAAAFRLTVSHTAHGSFAVVVGGAEPSCAGRAPIALRASTACCFAGLWRVSTKNQLGLASSAEETCSAPHPPPSARLSDAQLEFDVPDARLTELALCEVVAGTSFAELACVLQVSIVDAVLLHHFSVAVPLELRRGAALAFLPGAHTYVPLLSFRAEVQLAYFDADRPVFLVVSDLAPLPAAGATEVVLSSGLERVEPAPAMNCHRYAGHAHNASIEAWTLEGAQVRSTTFLRAPAGTSFLKLYYTLRLLEREGGPAEPRNTMHVAVWRNLSLAHAVCNAAPLPQTTRIGEVLSCSGLGASAVAGATALQGPTETVHGELGGLTSFVARALHAHVGRVQTVGMLAAFALPPDAALLAANVTAMLAGRLDFTDSFRAACSASVLCHFQYVHQGRGVHFLSSCDPATQDAARYWLRMALGVVHDAGHVQALCGLAQRQQRPQHASPYAFLIALVNTRAYLPRTVQWHDLQNHSAPLGVSRVAALFEFV